MSRSYKANNPYTILRSLNYVPQFTGADLRRAQAKQAKRDAKASKDARKVTR